MGCNSLQVRLGMARELREMTQAELAKALEIKRETVAQWETGKREPKAEQIFQVAKALNVSADYLLGLSTVPENDPGKKSAEQYTGLSDSSLSFLTKYKDDIGGYEWRIGQMVDILLQSPSSLLNALYNAMQRVELMQLTLAADPDGLGGKKRQAEAYPDGLGDEWPSEWPDIIKRLHAVQEQQQELKVILFDLSNSIVDFAKTELGVKDLQDKLASQERELLHKKHEMI